MAALDARQVEINEMYGKVSIVEFDDARVNLEQQRVNFANRKETFREDYEFYGAQEGTVHVSYTGSCTKCKLSLEIKEEHAIPGALDD